MARTIAYIPSSLSSKLEDFNILSIRTVAQDPFDLPDGKQTNHTVLYLKTTSNEYNCLDMNPQDIEDNGCLITSKNDSVSGAVKTVDLAVSAGTTAKAILDHVLIAGMDRYKFTQGGQGCRYWVDSVLVLLQKHQIIESEIHTARNALNQVWGQGGKLVPGAKQSAHVYGTFY